MTAEKRRVAHFTGDYQIPTDVYEEEFDETTRIYRVSSFHPSDKKAPDMSLSVREASDFITEGPKTANPKYVDPLDIYPGAELTFEGKTFEYKYAIMLAHAALSKAAWKDFAIVEADKEHVEELKQGLHVSEAQVLRLRPGRSNELERKKGYAGITEEALGFATGALQQTDITRLRDLPVTKNRKIA